MDKSKNRIGSVLIVTPVLREYHCARESFAAKESADHDFRCAETRLGSAKVKIVHTGFATGKWIEQVSPTEIPDLLLDTGTAGGLADGIAMGQILSGRTFLYGREPEIESGRGPGLSSQVKECSVLTVDSPVLDSRRRRALAGRADICTMESYFLAAAAEAWGCAFASVRVVSDLADEKTVPNFRKNVRSCCMELYGFLKQSLLNISN